MRGKWVNLRKEKIKTRLDLGEGIEGMWVDWRVRVGMPNGVGGAELGTDGGWTTPTLIPHLLVVAGYS